jgi:alkanesulfonate monooxygenase SsuD/methylene tetrahydromethanopterin reductase-like flavin-dependent oxidoreductase (luciferase family)
LYREALVRYQQPAQPIAVTLHGFVADTSQHAADTYYRAESAMLNIVAAERGFAKVTPEQLAARDAPGSMHAVGSPEKVVEKLLNHHEVFGHQRTMLQLAVGPLDHLEVMHAIELLGTRVAPAVREEIDRRSRPAPAGP